MELRHLRHFLAVAEELHFGRAAQRLSMSQPPLSVSIQQLEASLGARLFSRTSKSVHLTAAGQALLPQARAVIEQASQAARHARDVAQGLAGSLQIGLVGSMLYWGVPAALTAFQARYPKLRLTLREMGSAEQLTDLSRGALDVGFAHTTHVPAALHGVLVASQPFVACVPAGHRLATRKRLALAAFAAEPMASIARGVSADYRDRIVQMCQQAGFEPDIRHEMRHWLSVVSLVSQGMGVALVPQALRETAWAGAVFIPLEGVTSRYDTWCLWNPGREHAARQAFVEAVRKDFSVPADNPAESARRR